MGYTPNISARRLRAESATGHLVIAIITSFEAPLPLVSASLNALQCVTEEAPFNRFSFTTTIDMFHAGHLQNFPVFLTGSRSGNGAWIANTLPKMTLSWHGTLFRSGGFHRSRDTGIFFGASSFPRGPAGSRGDSSPRRLPAFGPSSRGTSHAVHLGSLRGFPQQMPGPAPI